MVLLEAAADGAVSVAPASFAAAEGQAQRVVATLETTGPFPLAQATLIVEAPSPFEVVAITPPSGSCSIETTGASCDLGDVPAGTSNATQIDIVGHQPVDPTEIRVRLQAANDGYLENDRAATIATITPAVVLEWLAEPGPVSVLLGEETTRSFVLRSQGVQAAREVVAQIVAGAGLEIQSVVADDALCSLSTDQSEFECRFAQPVEAGESRRIEVHIKGIAVGQSELSLSAYGLGYRNRQVDAYRQASVQVGQSADVRVADAPSTARGVDHVPLTVRFYIESVGLTPAENVTLELPIDEDLQAISIVASSGQCALAPGSASCTLGTMNPGDRVAIDIRLTSAVALERELKPVVSADGDADASNDEGSVRLSIEPNIDLEVLPLPAAGQRRVGESFEYSFTLRTATQPVPGSGVTVTWQNGEMEALGTLPSQGDCQVLVDRIDCEFGEIPATTDVVVAMQMRALMPGDLRMTVTARADTDVDAQDNGAATEFAVLARGNVSLALERNTIRGEVESRIDLPLAYVDAPADSQNVSVEFALPTSFTDVSARIDLGMPCVVAVATVQCELGELKSGARRSVMVSALPGTAGTFSIPVKVTATDDETPNDNAASVAVTIEPLPAPPPAPVPSPTPTGGGGGGGGGGMDQFLLLNLFMMLGAMHRRGRIRSR
jgi:hypothetical protein